MHRTVGTKNQNVRHTFGKKSTFTKQRKDGGNSKSRKVCTNVSKDRGQNVDPFVVSVFVDGKALEMQIDIRASISFIAERTFKLYWRRKD